MQTTSIPSTPGKVNHYYRCPKRIKDSKAGCDNAKHPRADKVEPEIWREVSSLLKDPERLRVGLKTMIERKKSQLKGDPTRETTAWLKNLDELATRLSELEDARLTAERELAKLRGMREEIEALEQDADVLLTSYERATPEDLVTLAPEQRHHVYRLVHLEVLANPDGSLEATGDLLLDISTLNVTRAGDSKTTNHTNLRFRVLITNERTEVELLTFQS
jgi:DNA repair exonuclease SbcCD ATPase subunit